MLSCCLQAAHAPNTTTRTRITAAGFGGVVARDVVLQQADWFVNSFAQLHAALKRYQVAVIGSGMLLLLTLEIADADVSRGWFV